MYRVDRVKNSKLHKVTTCNLNFNKSIFFGNALPNAGIYAEFENNRLIRYGVLNVSLRTTDRRTDRHRE